MKVLIIGDGGREHALAAMISESTPEPSIYVAAGHRNPGLLRLAEESGGRLYIANVLDPESVLKVAEEVAPDLIVVGPEEPQFHGVVDVLKERGFTVFGATSRLARIEMSKAFARELMWKHGIPGRLAYRAFASVKDALEYMEMAGDVVIKPARQAGGKGVKVLADTQAYLMDDRARVKKDYVKKLFNEIASKYRDIDVKILVEQRVEGVEYTVMVVTDGSTVLPLPAVQDHPHAFELDLGPETGGMGSIAGPGMVPPFLTREEFDRSVEIVRMSVEALQKEVGEEYRGAISGQMMLTAVWGPTLIEFYSRFGDPEISNLVPVIESDFLDILDRAATGRLAGAKLKFRDDLATVVKAVAPMGYPSNKSIAKEHPVVVDEGVLKRSDCRLLYAAVELREDGRMYTTGSRAFEVVCVAEKLEEASLKAEEVVTAIRCVDGWPLIHRADIGSGELLKERIELAEKIRTVYRYRAEKGVLGTSIVWVPGKGIFFDPLQNPVKIKVRR